MNLNKVMLGGRLTKEPTLRYTPTQIAVCDFSIAINKKWTDKSGQKQTQVEYVNIVVWSKLAEICNQYLSKGKLVFIEGELKTESYEKDGMKKYITKVVATNVQFIGSKTQESNDNSYNDGTSESYAGKEIPF